MIRNEMPETNLTKKDFYYYLPEDRIAQTPLAERDSSKLMTVDRATGELEHKIFHDIIDYLNEGDVLVINDSKVIPARLFGIKEDSGIDMEVLLLRARGLDTWEVLCRPGRRAKPGTTIIFGNGLLRAIVTDVIEDGNRIVKFEYEGDNLYSIFDQIGHMPLPPYITEKLENQERYQTVYSREEGSAAAPTAGLHFTPELLEKIKEKGCAIVPVLLHVGLGTFRPVKEEKITDHEMHSEYIRVTEDAALKINERKAKGGRVIAVGTTSCRTLESAAGDDGILYPCNTDTGIFIYPGYKFKITDALITNFHLPESTLLMLVSAFAGREKMLSAYNLAVAEKYRFFSFGDSMIIQ